MKRAFFLIFIFFCACITPQFLAATSTIKGIVSDSVTDQPISEALVQAVIDNQVIHSTTTANDGTYSLTNVQPDNYILIIRASEYQTQLVGVLVVNEPTITIDIKLVLGDAPIVGNVMDAITNDSIAGAIVSAYQGTILIESVTSRPGSGFFGLTGLAPGHYTIQASATGYQTQSIGANAQRNPTTVVEFGLIKDSNEISGISGTIIDFITQKPIMNALVAVFKKSVFVDFAVTDSFGNYMISGLAPGNYTIIANAKGFQSKIVEASVITNAKTIVDFAFRNNCRHKR